MNVSRLLNDDNNSKDNTSDHVSGLENTYLSCSDHSQSSSPIPIPVIPAMPAIPAIPAIPSMTSAGINQTGIISPRKRNYNRMINDNQLISPQCNYFNSPQTTHLDNMSLTSLNHNLIINSNSVVNSGTISNNISSTSNNIYSNNNNTNNLNMHMNLNHNLSSTSINNGTNNYDYNNKINNEMAQPRSKSLNLPSKSISSFNFVPRDLRSVSYPEAGKKNYATNSIDNCNSNNINSMNSISTMNMNNMVNSNNMDNSSINNRSPYNLLNRPAAHMENSRYPITSMINNNSLDHKYYPVEVVSMPPVKSKTNKRFKKSNSHWSSEEEIELFRAIIMSLPRLDYKNLAKKLNKEDSQVVRYKWKTILNKFEKELREGNLTFKRNLSGSSLNQEYSYSESHNDNSGSETPHDNDNESDDNNNENVKNVANTINKKMQERSISESSVIISNGLVTSPIGSFRESSPLTDSNNQMNISVSNTHSILSSTKSGPAILQTEANSHSNKTGYANSCSSCIFNSESDY
ncbi:SANT/Myb-like DNA-binding domain-containing protein ASCRUDRAFT_73743 [Ascoidea rubescens DSM 1968]|uniref:Myb-like domain-containing protein n=1 Tax=Ascoidea rubescens DSM 1968 TaxID=1344418 RepID=A0A1D2VR24_9ASCO|nr:hypothetical protein ASCRUDRAFT_73743 [Ascoidea rubescens DSM 1968]ODV64025.1 hypothetical protein ASCRUDRAFT_73743 [Ascoidea rubescens DSM 1968]